ncbi:MAG: alpha/beta hydrolase [Clostridia bacterium]|nr:alpha/beta hydrolase [Clostridia bacterium]
MTNLQLVTEWDKTFPKSDKVEHKKVVFHNHYGFTLAGDLYTPKNALGKLAAIAVCGPFGACKEQSAGLYAQEMAERGFLTLAFDPSFMGESSGEPRNMASVDINTEDFSAAVDFLSVQDNVDPEKIGIIGICGWGGMALNVVSMDTRIKATVTSTMYNMSRVNANDYFDAMDEDGRYALLQRLNKQRTEDYKENKTTYPGGVADPMPEAAPWYFHDYHNYYKTERGYHARSANSNEGRVDTAKLGFINTPTASRSSEIRSAVLMIHGDRAHSCYFSKDEFKKLKSDNKELLLIPNASHTDLYDKKDIIPFDKIESFFKTYLK